MNNIIIELSQEDRTRLDKIIELMSQRTVQLESVINGSVAVKTSAQKQEDAEAPTEAETVEHPIDNEELPFEPPTPAPDRRTVKSVAVKKIQAGFRDDVKSLIVTYGTDKIDLIPEDRLADFLSDLEKIGG